MDDLFDAGLAFEFPPTRAGGLDRLKAMTGALGSKYAARRNTDFGPGDRSNVTCLSPYVRTRRVLERELVEAALSRFAPATAEKFIQEVCWRTYFKGWLERRPAVWKAYLSARDEALGRLEAETGLASAYAEAVEGRTGIGCFDAWARELVETGYLHNHARMWFASIWLFTLKLPLELGADFFLKHLMDGDPASNTLSWRWVGGLHTPGKTYLARRSNISKYTDGRFSPDGLAGAAPPVDGFQNPALGPVPPKDPPPEGRIGLLLTEEDLGVESLAPEGCEVVGAAGCVFPDDRSPGGAGAQATSFAEGALGDALKAAECAFGTEARRLAADGFEDALVQWARGADVDTVAAGWPTVGWVRPRLEATRSRLEADGRRLVYLRRDWDDAFWPFAKAGFFGLKKYIPDTLAALGLPV